MKDYFDAIKEIRKENASEYKCGAKNLLKTH